MTATTLRKKARTYRGRHDLPAHGYIMTWSGTATGWSLRPAPHRSRPNVIAVAPNGNLHTAIGGNPEDGAALWNPPLPA